MAKILDMSGDETAKLDLDFHLEADTGIKVLEPERKDESTTVLYYARGRRVTREDYLAIVATGRMTTADFETVLSDWFESAVTRVNAILEEAYRKFNVPRS